MPATQISVRCCIAGGGPAGMVLGFLLARAGVEVLVLEKHGDFLRDFRGDTIHPSTLEIIHELGMLDALLAQPHQKVTRIIAQFGETHLTIADFSHLPTHCRFTALMPQWDFLDFLAHQATSYPGFALRMRSEATGLIEEAGRVVGVTAAGPDGALEIRASLVIGADGRHSTVRAKAGLAVEELGAPMDVLWFRLTRGSTDPEGVMARFDAGQALISLNRGDYWQFGFVIPKGAFERIQAAGLSAFRDQVARLAPYAASRVGEIDIWDKVKLLTVAVDRLRQWYRPGLLCIGDAAHAMSPVGGVGINLAIQDAVAAANLLAAPLRANQLSLADLRRVQQRRALPTRLTQSFQLMVQNRIVKPVLAGSGKLSPPLVMRLVARYSLLRRFAGRLIGMGIRPEHVRTEVRSR